MATRLYFSAASNTSGLTPAFDGGWNYTTEALRRDLLRAKSAGESLTIGSRIGAWTATAGQTALDRQFISQPLAAQTISGTFAGQVMVREYATSDNVDQLYVAVKVIDSGGTVVATLYSFGNATTTAEFVSNVSHRNKRIADGDALSSYSCAAGDRLLVEIGYRNSTAGTSPEASAKWGAPSSGSDLPQNETQTTDGVGWIEFSGDLGWLYTASVSGGVTLAGDATTSYQAASALFEYQPSGGTTLGGSASTSYTQVFSASVSGGTTLAGTAATEYVANSGVTYTYSVSGGFTLAGSATTAEVQVYTASVSGGVTLAGTASLARTYAAPVSGGVTLSGSAATSELAVFTHQPTGGVTLAGSAPVAAGRTFFPSGGVTLAGTATLAITHAVAVSGGVELSGAATTSYLSAGATEYPYAASGGFTLAGTAESLQVRLPTGNEFVVDRMVSHYVGSLIVYDTPKPPKPQPKTFSYSVTWIVPLSGSAQVEMRSMWTTRADLFIPKIRGAAPVSRAYAAQTGVNQLAAIRKRKAQEEALLLAL